MADTWSTNPIMQALEGANARYLSKGPVGTARYYGSNLLSAFQGMSDAEKRNFAFDMTLGFDPENVDAADAGLLALMAGTLGGKMKAGKRVAKAIKNPNIGHNGGPAMVDTAKMYGKAPGSDPRYFGAAPDRSDFSLLRLDPARGPKPRTVDALEAMRSNRNGIRDQLLADIKAGEKLGGSDWYNTEELRDWFVAELGEKRGDAEWRDFMNLMGATSTGNKVDSNIGIASMYRNQGGPQQAVDLAKRHLGRDKAAGEVVLPEGYGHKMQDNHAKNVIANYEGEWAPTPQGKVAAKDNTATRNPKPRGFANSLLGNMKNIAADLHFTRYMAMASGRTDWLDNGVELSGKLADKMTSKYGDKIKPYTKMSGDGKYPKFNARKAVEDGVVDMKDLADEPTVFVGKPDDNEYKAFEDYIYELGDELGMTGPQVQANLWMGAAKRTGVDDTSQGTFMQLIRNRADKRAKATGKTREQVLREFVRDRGLLQMMMTTGAAGAGAGAMSSGE